MQNQPKKVLDRCKVGYTLRSTVRSKMKAAGYDSEQIEIVTQAFIESNDINDLPEDIRCQFKLTTYVRPYPVTDELRKECIDYINETADEFEERKRSGEWPAREIEEKMAIPISFVPISVVIAKPVNRFGIASTNGRFMRQKTQAWSV